jgi:hypothetical protein
MLGSLRLDVRERRHRPGSPSTSTRSAIRFDPERHAVRPGVLASLSRILALRAGGGAPPGRRPPIDTMGNRFKC